MAWRDRIPKEIKFREAVFWVDGAETEFGRRLAEHEFPQQDKPLIQDMGRKSRQFTIDGYVFGDDYLTLRDQLLAACEQSGPGVLVHPYYGQIKVSCKNIRFRDSAREARMVRFNIEFVETDDQFVLPVTVPDPRMRVLSVREQVLSAVNNAFLSVYVLSLKPYVTVKNAQQGLSSILSSIGLLRKSVSTQADFVRSLSSATQQVAALIYSPVLLAEDLIGLLTYGTDIINDTIPNVRNSFDELKEIFTTNQESTGNPLSDPIIYMTQHAATAAMAGLIPDIDFDSLDDALNIRDVLLEQINIITERIDVDDKLYSDFQDLRESIVREIDARASDLSRLALYLPQQTLPALVVSNMLYGSTDQEQDIINRNRIRHPGYVPGGRDVEVLINAQ